MQSNRAANAYASATRSVGTPRTIEYQAFQRVTSQLRAAIEPDAPFNALAEAVFMNTKLWLALGVDLLSPQNQLPKDLAAQLFNLAEFSRRHGLKVLERKADAQDLIDVNTSVMRGLRGVGDSSSQAEASVETASQPATPAAAVGA